MTHFNTIILKYGEGRYSKRNFKKYQKGDCIFGEASQPKEIKRWTREQEAEAMEELKKYKCSYSESDELVDVEEYALEYCDTDEDGEFEYGSDFDLAETK